MTDKEINEFYKLLLKEQKAVKKESREESEASLKRIGILDKKGKIAYPYNNVFMEKE